MTVIEMALLYTRDQTPPREIARISGVSLSTVRRYLLKAGVQMRSVSEATQLSRPTVAAKLRGAKRITPEMRERINAGVRARHAGKQDSWRIKTNGYAEYCSRQSPHYRRLVHVVLVEKSIGRRLKRGEVVHHIDGNKLNNSLENLHLMTNSAHVSLHRALRKQEATS